MRGPTTAGGPARRAPHGPGGPAAGDRTSALLRPCFFAPATFFFVAALVILPAIVRQLTDHFYQARVLAVTHMITLGWISMVMLGVLYRYVPGLTKGRLPAPRAAVAQWAIFVAGVVGLVVHFWLGRWTATALAAALLLVSALLVCRNLWPLLLRAPERGVAEVGVLLATGFFAVAAALGTLLAADKRWSLLGGSTITNLGAHAHLAALGWVGLTVCALSFRFLPAFLLPTRQLAGMGRWQVSALAVAVVLLAAALLARSPLLLPAALAVAGTLVAYLVLIGRLVGSRRLPIDWTAGHALASAVWCAIAVATGVTLAFLGVETPLGARLAAAYGIAGLLGWMSNLVIGMSYKLFPGFVAATRAERGRPPAPIASLSVPGALPPLVFVGFNVGVAASALGVVLGLDALALAGAGVLAVSGSVYGAGTLRTLAFALVDPPPAGPLAVLP
jgi:hypothetical protein